MKKNQDTFLRLLGGNKNKYKRYLGSPLRYAGGKSLAVGHIIEHIPSNVKKIVSPFFGGGSFEIACAKELGITVKGYDIFELLVNYWDKQINHPVELANKISEIPHMSKEMYNVVKDRLRKHWKGEEEIEDDLSLAADYWINHNLSYGPAFLGWMSKIYKDQNRYRRLVSRVSNFRCKNLSVNCAHFMASIPRHNNDFLYCDPPYYLTEDSKVFKGIYPQRNFPIHHKDFSHLTLCSLLHSHKGGFILSYNDCKRVRNMYSGFKIIKVDWQYTMGQGETRIGKNRAEKGDNGHIKESDELLIISEGH